MAWCVAQAKAMAFMHGCNLDISLGYKKVILESDSLESISCLNDSLENGNWRAYPILAKFENLGLPSRTVSCLGLQDQPIRRQTYRRRRDLRR